MKKVFPKKYIPNRIQYLNDRAFKNYSSLFTQCNQTNRLKVQRGGSGFYLKILGLQSLKSNPFRSIKNAKDIVLIVCRLMECGLVFSQAMISYR